MKCHQCNNPAMFKVGEEGIPLCLECKLKLSQVMSMEREENERMLNYLSDQMYDIVSLPPLGPRFPAKKTICLGDVVLNNIKVDNSRIGVLNTGNIETVDMSVTSLNQSGNAELGNAIKELTNAVVASEELQNDIKNQLIEILSVISSEATAPPERQRKGVINVLIKQLKNMLSVSTELTQLWSIWGPIIMAAFAS